MSVSLVAVFHSLGRSFFFGTFRVWPSRAVGAIMSNARPQSIRSQVHGIGMWWRWWSVRGDVSGRLVKLSMPCRNNGGWSGAKHNVRFECKWSWWRVRFSTRLEGMWFWCVFNGYMCDIASDPYEIFHLNHIISNFAKSIGMYVYEPTQAEKYSRYDMVLSKALSHAWNLLSSIQREITLKLSQCWYRL